MRRPSAKGSNISYHKLISVISYTISNRNTDHTSDENTGLASELKVQAEPKQLNATNDELPGSHAVAAELHFIEDVQRVSRAVFQPINDQLCTMHISTASAAITEKQIHCHTNYMQST